MGKYDVLDKEYFSQPSHLAELIGNGVYHGRVKVSGEELERLSGKYPSLTSVSGELERDGICLCRSHGIKYGLEIENYPDYGMPGRTLTYDASEYEKEAAEMRSRHDREKDLTDFAEQKSGMTKEEEEDMCKAYRELVKDWKEEGRLQALFFAIKNLMESAQVTAEQALDLLKITGEDRVSIKKML